MTFQIEVRHYKDRGVTFIGHCVAKNGIFRNIIRNILQYGITAEDDRRRRAYYVQTCGKNRAARARIFLLGTRSPPTGWFLP